MVHCAIPVGGSVPVLAASDRAAHRAQYCQNCADHEQDDADHQQEMQALDNDPDDQENQAENDHCCSTSDSSACALTSGKLAL